MVPLPVPKLEHVVSPPQPAFERIACRQLDFLFQVRLRLFASALNDIDGCRLARRTRR